MRTLRQKRMYESQLAQLSQQTFNMESAALATENLRNTMATVDAMKQANKELRKQYGKIDIDKIEVPNYYSQYGVTINNIAPISRPCTMIWRTYWNKQTRSKNLWAVPMLSQMRSTKPNSRPVRCQFCVRVSPKVEIAFV